MIDDTRERLIRLEAEVEHLTATVATVAAKVDAMHELLTQARGARWVIFALVPLGGFLGAKFHALLPWLAPLPK
ncbi:MAG: hypothetical protein LCH38_15235 [Proteobacteria bacterium]|nr:hypothetical protein [Pseudomonadota bacterium]